MGILSKILVKTQESNQLEEIIIPKKKQTQQFYRAADLDFVVPAGVVDFVGEAFKQIGVAKIELGSNELDLTECN